MSAARDAFEAALGTWLARQAVAEERLTSFAFREGQPAVDVPVPSSSPALGAWILATIGDPDVAAFLRRLEDGAQPIAGMAAGGVFGLEPGDRVALAARVGVLAASGLVTRDLEADRVALTELGRAALVVASPPLAPGPAAPGTEAPATAEPATSR